MLNLNITCSYRRHFLSDLLPLGKFHRIELRPTIARDYSGIFSFIEIH